MKRHLVPVVGLVVLLLIAFSSIAQQPEETLTLCGELKVGKRYHFVPVGKDFADQGTPVELIAIDKEWVKVKTGTIDLHYIWVNLRQLGAIVTTEDVRNEKPGGKER